MAVVKNTFRLRDAFLPQPLMPSSFLAERNDDRRYGVPMNGR